MRKFTRTRTGALTPILLALVLSLALTALAMGCSKSKRQQARFDSGVPTMRTPMEITGVTQRGPYLEVALLLAEREAWTWVIPSDGCREVMVQGQTIDYIDNGPQGTWRHNDTRCQSMGMGPLRLWRDRNSRSTPAGIPRSQATYRTIHIDEDVALLRGVFPQATFLRFERADDLVAVVPRGGQCERPIESSPSSLEYRGRGHNVLSLVGPSGLCQIRAILLPPSSSEPRNDGSANEVQGTE